MKQKLLKKLIIISALLITALALSSCSTLNNATSQTTVSVTGTGVVSLDADIVKFSINVRETADTTSEAQQLANKKMAEILDILKAHGIEEGDISTTALNFSSSYHWDYDKQVQVKDGEEVSQTVYVTMKNIDQFPTLADDLGSKINGISFYNVSFDSSQRQIASDIARERAYQDALNKARLYADQAGLTLSQPISITEGFVNFSSTNFARLYAEEAVDTIAAAAEVSYDTQTPTGVLTSEIEVSVTFSLR